MIKIKSDRYREQVRERNAHKLGLEIEHNLVGHPKADKLYELAWDYGHSSGYSEITSYYADLADLLEV